MGSLNIKLPLKNNHKRKVNFSVSHYQCVIGQNLLLKIENSSPFTKHLPKATQKWPYQRSAPTFTPAVKHSLTNRLTWNYTQVMFTCRWLPTSIAMMLLFMDSQSDFVIILMKNVNMLKSSSTTKTCVVDELCSKTSRNPTPTTGSQLSLL